MTLTNAEIDSLARAVARQLIQKTDRGTTLVSTGRKFECFPLDYCHTTVTKMRVLVAREVAAVLRERRDK